MDYILKNKQSFGQVAKEYKKYRGSYNDTLYKSILSAIKNKKTEISILDLGCGVGNSTEPLLVMAQKLNIKTVITGCDPDVEMLKQAQMSAKKNKLSIGYVQGSAEKLPFEKNQFDLIISGSAFHWFANNKSIKEIQRVMKNTAVYFVFWTQNIKTQKPSIDHELYKEYGFKGIPQELRDPKFVKEFFTKSGFSKVKTLKISYTEKRTIADTIGLIKTNSGYAVLSAKDKKEFIQKITKAYKEALGNKMNTLNQNIHVCMGFK